MKKNKNTTITINSWVMIRDVLVASMNKGLFAPALLGMIIVIMILKMPSTDVSKLFFSLLNFLVEKYLIGYITALFSMIGWLIHTKIQRRLFHTELQRISKERNYLQSQLSNNKTKSSEE